MSDVIVPVIVALVAATPGIFAFFNTRRAQSREDNVAAIDAWQELLDPLRLRVSELEDLSQSQRVRIRALEKADTENRDRIRALEDELVRFSNGTSLLINQIRAEGKQPVWIPNRLNDSH